MYRPTTLIRRRGAWNTLDFARIILLTAQRQTQSATTTPNAIVPPVPPQYTVFLSSQTWPFTDHRFMWLRTQASAASSLLDSVESIMIVLFLIVAVVAFLGAFACAVLFCSWYALHGAPYELYAAAVGTDLPELACTLFHMWINRIDLKMDRNGGDAIRMILQA
jgi:hypothetical protein